WLQRQEWYIPLLEGGLTDSRTLHAYGVGLAALGLVWVAARIGLRSSDLFEHLTGLQPGFDRVVLGGLVLGQLLVGATALVPELVRELRPADAGIDLAATTSAAAFGPGAWLLLGMLALVLLATLWERSHETVVHGLVLLAATIPVLIAGAGGGESN